MTSPSDPTGASAIAPARDGNIAVREELEGARKAGTVEAYRLFLARHPDHPLSETARQELQRLERNGPRKQD